MQAMVLDRLGGPLSEQEMAISEPKDHQVLIRVHACAVCRTDLHILNGELPSPKLPLILGHQIVGTVVKTGQYANALRPGERIGVSWLGYSDGTCSYCKRGKENLCSSAKFTGYTIDGGYAEYALADSRYCFSLPKSYGHIEAAPLLCAGIIGYRSYRMAGKSAERLGIYGFGAAAHIITQIAVYEGKQVYAFTRPGDLQAQQFARDLGAAWAGHSLIAPPHLLDAAIIFAPVGGLVPAALEATARGGRVVCAGIHMSDIPSFPYRLLWGERMVCSVANMTRRDGLEFLALAPRVPVTAAVETFSLQEANLALDCLAHGRVKGAAVLEIGNES